MNVGQEFNPYGLFYGAVVPDWLLCRPELSPAAKMLYARLCKYAGSNGAAFPSLADLSTALGTNERQIRRWVDELRDVGLVRTERGHRHQALRYVFLWHAWMEGEIREDKLSGLNVLEGTNCPVSPDNLSGLEGTICPDSSYEENHGKRIKEDMPAAAAPRAVPATPHHQLLAAFADACGYTLPNGAQEASGAQKLLRGGWTQEQVLDCYHHLKAQDFWADKHVSLQTVARNIGAWKTAKRNGKHPAAEPDLHERAAALIQETLRYQEGLNSGK